MAFSFDVFWSYRSPYCYLALDRILAMHRDYDVEVDVRPVYPMAVRDADFFKRTNPLYRPYHTVDSHRVAEYLGVPFRRPVPDPIVMDMETSAIAKEQPYVERVTRLGMAAAMAGRGLQFTEHVMRLLWDGSTTGWHEGTHLADAMTRAGLDAAALDKAVAEDPETYDRALDENARAQIDAGHWGAPLLVFDEEPFYGQDRLDVLLWQMKRKGLKARQA